MHQHGHALQVWLRLLGVVTAAPGARAMKDPLSHLTDVVGQLDARTSLASQETATPLNLDNSCKALECAHTVAHCAPLTLKHSSLAWTPTFQTQWSTRGWR